MGQLADIEPNIRQHLNYYANLMDLIEHRLVVCGVAQVGELIRVQSETVGANDGSRPQTRKKLIEYKNTPEVDVMRSNLGRINKAIESRWIDLELSDDGFVAMQAQMRSRKDKNSEDDRQLNLTKTQLYRVFNDPEFKTGPIFMVVGGKTYPSSFAVSSPLMAKELLRQILVACIHLFFMLRKN